MSFSCSFMLDYMFTFFFLNDPAPTEISSLSLHDALPIFWCRKCLARAGFRASRGSGERRRTSRSGAAATQRAGRSEEHTSELQSQSNLVCRLLLEKKNTQEGVIIY